MPPIPSIRPAVLLEPAAQRSPRVRFQVSYIHALYYFVWMLARKPSGSGPFAGSRFDTPRRRRLLTEFSQLALPSGAPSRGTEEVTPPNWSFHRLCAVTAGRARDLGDFCQRLLASMPEADVSRLASILENFAPIFDALVWTCCEPTLYRWQKVLDDYAKERGLEGLLERVARFYGGAWGPEVPFQVVLNPVAGHGPASSTVESDVVTLSLSGEPANAAKHLGIVVHEICHSLHENQSGRLETDLDTRLLRTSPALAVYGRLALDEALATAIGNAWAVRRLSGIAASLPWYDNWHIQAYAAALYPLVDDYLEQRKTLDQAFLEQALIIYRSAIGDRMWQYDNLFAHVAVLSDRAIRDDEAEEGSVVARFADHIDYSADLEELQGIDERNLDRLLTAVATRIVVCRAGDESKLNVLRDRIGWLRQLHFPRDEPFVAGRVGGEDAALFVFSLLSTADLDDALRQLRERWTADGIVAFSPRRGNWSGPKGAHVMCASPSTPELKRVQ